MGIRYENLNEEVRRYMLEESRLGGHYDSPRLTQAGHAAWVALIEEAITSHDDDWLAAELLKRGHLNEVESYTKNSKPFNRRINQPQAAEQLAEGEFNRYYLRGLCHVAKNRGIIGLIVYRGKAVMNPRPESEAKIGTTVSVDLILEKLRTNDFVSISEALGVPGGPNSGITCKLP